MSWRGSMPSASNETHLSRSAFAVGFRLTPLAGNTVLGALVEPPTHGAFIRAASSEDFAQRLDLRGGAVMH